jgi:hypothetical protein
MLNTNFIYDRMKQIKITCLFGQTINFFSASLKQVSLILKCLFLILFSPLVPNQFDN